MTVPVKKTDHVDEALDRLTGLYEEKPICNAITASYMRQIQDLENAIFDLLWTRLLANAIGVYLDFLGAMVDEPRGGRGDERYRLAITVKARVNRSHGRTRDIRDVLRLVTKAWHLYIIGGAKFRVDVVDPVDGVELFRWLNKTRLAGVGFELAYVPRSQATAARWGSTTGTIDGEGAWGDATPGTDEIGSIYGTGIRS